MSQSSPIDVASSEHVCYVHCNFCNTILAVSVPGTSLFNVVTVRCGHCANLLSVNMGSLMQTLNPLHHHHHQDPHHYHHQNMKLQNDNLRTLDDINKNYESSSSKCNKSSMMAFPKHDEPPRLLPVRAAPEKRQRVPSAYNRFIKEEIQRIKASNPDISHREAFSSAAKNWAHFPHIHFGLSNLDSNKQAKVDEVFAGEGTQKTQQFY